MFSRVRSRVRGMSTRGFGRPAQHLAHLQHAVDAGTPACPAQKLGVQEASTRHCRGWADFRSPARAAATSSACNMFDGTLVLRKGFRTTRPNRARACPQPYFRASRWPRGRSCKGCEGACRQLSTCRAPVQECSLRLRCIAGTGMGHCSCCTSSRHNPCR